MGALITTTTKLDSFTVDVMMEDTYSNKLGITDYPVEEDSNISDHAQILPKTYDLIGGSVTLTEGGLNVAKINADYNALLGVQEKRVPFTVDTGITILKNMLIEDFSVTRDKTNATVLFYKAHLKEVRIVGTEDAPVPSARAVPTDGEEGGATTLAEQKTENQAAPLLESAPPSLLSYYYIDEGVEEVNAFLEQAATAASSDIPYTRPSPAEIARLMASTPADVPLAGILGGGG